MFSLIFCLLISSFIPTHQNVVKLLTKDVRVRLPSGDAFPMIGFGTSRVLGTETVKNTLDDALAAGYRLFDTAQIYGNEEDIGKALRELLPKHNLTRSDIFLTSKLAARDYAMGDKAYLALENSLQLLNVTYLDLYLIHFPGIPTPDGPRNFSKLRDETWENLSRGVKNGLVRNLGVSNYNIKHLKELLANDHGVKPALNQVEWHPEYHQNELLEFCNNNNIVLQAYSSLGGTDNSDLLTNPEVNRISDKLKKSSAQVLLRWAFQQNVAVIPKSLNKKHMELNIDLNFEIPEEDMRALNEIPQKPKLKWDPEEYI